MDVIEVQHWPSNDAIAQLIVVNHRRQPRPADIRHSVEAARARRPAAIRTGALFPDVADAFAAEGFRVIDTLSLLRRDLDGADMSDDLRTAKRAAASAGAQLRTMRRRHHDAASAIDRAAFGEEWGHRTESLRAIAGATPQAFERIVVADRRLVGIAITGVGEGRGYLQRLAVDPRHQRRGLGRLLVLDSLVWLRRRHASDVMVNTGVDNVAALALYESLGFTAIPDRLRVMELAIDG